MAKLRILYIKNRVKKIARNKKKRKGKKHQYNGFISRKIVISNSQKKFDEDKFYKKIKSDNNNVNIIIPQNFSIIKNPDISLITLKQINWAFMNTNIHNIFFDYSLCDNLGLDASVLTDLLVLNGEKYRKKINCNIDISGNVPTKYKAGEVFYNSGLLKHLGLTNIEDPLVERLDPFKNISKNPANATNQTIVYINNCFKRKGYELNDDGIDYFNNLVGEVIGNADEHSGKDGEWYVSGHFSEAENIEYGKGSLIFISIGNTIYENLKYNTKSIKTKEKLTEHLKLHKKLYDFFWNEETSLTIFGLQYKISSESDENHLDRGTGTIKFIDSFSNLGKNINGDNPIMSITSGNTHIIFDGTYKLKENSKGVPIIAFNPENDITKKPDSNKVKMLQNRFPGVIISVEFYVDKRYFDKIKEVGKSG